MLSLVAVIFAAIAEASVLISNTSVPPVAGCGKPLPEGQAVGNISNVTLTSGGYQRSYLISIPPNYYSYVQTALILSYHGGTRTAEDQLMLDDLTNPKFNPDSFVIYPQGINVGPRSHLEVYFIITKRERTHGKVSPELQSTMFSSLQIFSTKSNGFIVSIVHESQLLENQMGVDSATS